MSKDDKVLLYTYAKKDHLIQLKNFLLLTFVVADLFLIFTITFFTEQPKIITFVSYFDLFVCFCLFLNLIYIYHTSTQRLKPFIKSHLIDILSMIPFNFIFLRFFAIIRIIQILQVFKIINISRTKISSFKFFIRNQLVESIFIILVVYIILSSVVLEIIDPAFTNIFTAIWFTIGTMTTVGYGDITPITTQGKILAMGSIVFGVVFVSIFTAAMSSMYMEKPERKTRTAIKNYINYLKDTDKKLIKRVRNLEKDNEELINRVENLENKVDKLDSKMDKIILLLNEK